MMSNKKLRHFFKRPFCLLVIFWIVSGYFNPVTGQDKNIVTYRVVHSDNILPGDSVRVKISLAVIPGWYIYAPSEANQMQELQLTQIVFKQLPAGVRSCGKIQLPQAHFSKGHEVYEGDNNVYTQTFTIDKQMAQGDYVVQAQLQYQACSDAICFPPVTEKIDINLHVKDKPLSAEAILNQACSRAETENKKVFIIFHSSWCVWCRKMDTAMNNEKCKKFFDDNYIVEHLTVYESDAKQSLENPGALAMLKKYQGPRSGIPFWLIFDAKRKLLADSQVRPAGSSLNSSGKNVGCPRSPEEVKHFLNVLKKTSGINDAELKIIGKVFSEIK